jgi:hypothetical protein
MNTGLLQEETCEYEPVARRMEKLNTGLSQAEITAEYRTVTKGSSVEYIYFDKGTRSCINATSYTMNS